MTLRPNGTIAVSLSSAKDVHEVTLHKPGGSNDVEVEEFEGATVVLPLREQFSPYANEGEYEVEATSLDGETLGTATFTVNKEITVTDASVETNEWTEGPLNVLVVTVKNTGNIPTAVDELAVEGELDENTKIRGSAGSDEGNLKPGASRRVEIGGEEPDDGYQFLGNENCAATGTILLSVSTGRNVVGRAKVTLSVGGKPRYERGDAYRCSELSVENVESVTTTAESK